MPKGRHTSEQIITKLREAEVLQAQDFIPAPIDRATSMRTGRRGNARGT